jgi:hypothetical protein
MMRDGNKLVTRDDAGRQQKYTDTKHDKMMKKGDVGNLGRWL